MINVEKLAQEIRGAGIPIHGVSSTGRVDYKAEATQAQREQGASIVAAHDPSSTEDQRLAGLALPKKALAALVIRLDSNSTAAERSWAQAIINDFGAKIRAARA